MEISPLQRHVNPADIAPERLAGNPALTEQQKIGEASRQFEAVLLKQILDSSQKTVIPSSFSDNSTSASIYHEMITSHLADSISKSGGFGLAKTFEQQLTRQDAAIPKDNAPVKLHPLNSSHVHARRAVAKPNIEHRTSNTEHRTDGKRPPNSMLDVSRNSKAHRANFSAAPIPGKSARHSIAPAANTSGFSHHERTSAKPD